MASWTALGITRRSSSVCITATRLRIGSCLSLDSASWLRQQIRCFSSTSSSVSRSGHFISNSSSSSSSSTRSRKGLYKSPLDPILDKNAPCMIYGTMGNPPVRPLKYLECGLLEDHISFRTCVYGKTMKPPYIHTNEHRIYAHIKLKDLPLDDVGQKVLQQVVGFGRYDVEKNVLKMSCNTFPSRIENKRYLVRQIDRTILACQRVSKALPDAAQAIPAMDHPDENETAETTSAATMSTAAVATDVVV